MTVAVSLFAGGLDGFDHAARRFGVDPLGIEWDDAACATREAAGLRTLQADVAALDPMGFGPVDLLIGTPPCQAFSTAGKGKGRQALGAYQHALHRMQAHQPLDVDELDQACGDPRGHLVLEPLRWALALKPRWIALEQVRPVLPLWEAMAEVLRAHGYSTWTGVLSAERYGAPQTRKRAFLAASLTGPVSEPPATHQRYVAPRRREKQALTLFDAPEPERIVLPEDRGLEPWVSMAEALGWDDGSAAYRISRGTGRIERHGDRPPTPASEPAPAVTAHARSAEWAMSKSDDRSPRAQRGEAGNRPRPINAPAPTIHTRTDLAEWTTERPARTVVTTRRSDEGIIVGRQLSPGEGRNVGGHGWTGHLSDDGWPGQRPATTLAGDPRVFPPGGHLANDGRDNTRMVGGPEGAVRVTLREALILQAFDPDLPVQGSRSKQFEQVGNAVPPPLAHAVLTALGVGA